VSSLVAPMIDLNPFHWVGDRVEEGLADTFTAMMMSLWSAGLWLIEMVFGVIDRFTTPDVANPSLGRLYGVMLWLSLFVALVIGFGQIAVAAIRRDGSSLGSLVMGLVQYGAVVAGWIAVCAGLIVGSGGLTRALLHELLNVDGFAGYSASAGMTNQVGGTVQAAVLGVCSLFLLIPAAFGYLLIMLVREAGLLILTATMPIAAAGALGDGTKAWLWKSVRWFTAACLTAPLLALVVGLGVQISRAAFPDGAEHAPGQGGGLDVLIDSNRSNVGMAVVGCVILFVACFCPMVLFRLLAFVDPGTASGASFRTTLAANGGVSGLLSGRRAAEDQGSGAATQVGADGRAASEGGADAETANRFQSRAAKAFGIAGKAVGGGIDAMGTVASAGASMGVDVMGQSGVGHQGYYDTTPPRRPGRRSPVRTRVGQGWDEHSGGGVANDPPHIANADEAAAAAEDGAMLA
jgi:type IV secretion system protein TrbL